jgi:hypothetical protein
LETKVVAGFHYHETVPLHRHEIESAYLPSFKNEGAIPVPDEHVIVYTNTMMGGLSDPVIDDTLVFSLA